MLLNLSLPQAPYVSSGIIKDPTTWDYHEGKGDRVFNALGAALVTKQAPLSNDWWARLSPGSLSVLLLSLHQRLECVIVGVSLSSAATAPASGLVQEARPQRPVDAPWRA